MTRFMKYLLTIGFLSILLVACGTNTDTTNSVKDTTNKNEIEQTVEETEQETEQEQKQEIEKENEEPQQEIENNPEEEPKEQEEKESVEETSPATEVKISYSYQRRVRTRNCSSGQKATIKLLDSIYCLHMN